MRSAFEFINGTRRDGDRGRGAIVLVAALSVFVAALSHSSTSAYGAPEAKPPPKKAAKKEPKVEAGVRRGQLNVLGGDDDVAIGRDAAAPIQTLVDLGGDE